MDGTQGHSDEGTVLKAVSGTRKVLGFSSPHSRSKCLQALYVSTLNLTAETIYRGRSSLRRPPSIKLVPTEHLQSHHHEPVTGSLCWLYSCSVGM